MIITPKNWKSFQHYKDRSPAWIKLHKGLMTDYEFVSLPVASRALAPMLWLLASEYEEGAIDGSIKKIAFRVHLSVDELQDALSPLIDSGFFVSSEPLADRNQPAIPEKRREREYREEKEEEAIASATPLEPVLPDDEPGPIIPDDEPDPIIPDDEPAIPDPAIPEREYFIRGREVLGSKSGALIAKLLKAKGMNVALARAAIEQASQKESPTEYIAACCRGGPIAKPLTEFQRKQQETNDVRAELRSFGSGSRGSGALDRLLPDYHRERSESVRSGAGQALLELPRASGRGGH